MLYSGITTAFLFSILANSALAAPKAEPEPVAPTPVARSDVTQTLDKRTVYSGVSLLANTFPLWRLPKPEFIPLK